MSSTARAKVAELAQRNQVRVLWRDLGDDAGHAQGELITLDQSLDDHTALSTFFHELAHVECYRRKLYADFHEPDLFERSAKYCDWREGLKVERAIDDMAEQLAARDMPELGGIRKAYHEEPQGHLRKCIESAMPQRCKRK